jgi:hypothetical protein
MFQQDILRGQLQVELFLHHYMLAQEEQLVHGGKVLFKVHRVQAVTVLFT